MPFEAALGVQFVAQGGLVDDAGGLGFVVQALGVEADQLAVCAGLAVGHDDVGVQVRVAAARGFVLVGDRHQAGQPLQVVVAGDRVVHPGVAGVLVQVGHGGLDGFGVGGGEDFFGDVVGQRPEQRNTFGRGERQVETVHTRVGELAPGGPVGGDRRHRATA